MKKIIINLIILTFSIVVLITATVFGQEASTTPTITSKPTTAQEEAVKDLKEKVANKVEEIRRKNSRAVAGRITELSENTIKIKKIDGKDFQIKLDETLTKYYQISGATQKEIKEENLEKDDYIIATGVISDDFITANSIFIDQPYLVGNGKITEVDKESYNIKVLTADKTTYTLSIENLTKQQIINIKTLEIEKSGFSKIIAGDSIHFVAKILGDEENNTYQAEKTLIIPQEYFIK